MEGSALFEPYLDYSETIYFSLGYICEKINPLFRIFKYFCMYSWTQLYSAGRNVTILGELTENSIEMPGEIQSKIGKGNDMEYLVIEK